jgi:hypothetical protein
MLVPAPALHTKSGIPMPFVLRGGQEIDRCPQSANQVLPVDLCAAATTA